MHLYIPTFNDELLFLIEKLVLPDNKLIQFDADVARVKKDKSLYVIIFNYNPTFVKFYLMAFL